MLFYTYVHYNMQNKPIYVGKGTGDRAYTKRNYGEDYTVKIIDDNLFEETALELESFLIQQIGIKNLYNKIDNGNRGRQFFNIDYKNPYKFLNTVDKTDARLTHNVIKQFYRDAYRGNVDAILFIFNNLPLHEQPKINKLLQSYSEKSWKK